MRALLLGFVLISTACIGTACGAPSDAGVDASVTGPFAPGISGGALVSRIEVIAVDELTREPIAAAVTVDRGGLGPVSGTSPFVHESAETFERADVTVRVMAGARTTQIRWMGVRGTRVVIPVPRRETQRFEVDVRGSTPSGTSALELTPLAPLRILRSGGVGGDAVSCPSIDPCRVSLEVPAGVSGLVATASGADATPLGFALAELDSAQIDFDFATSAPVSIDAPLPAPGAGIDAVVGVPGITTDGRLARLPATTSAFVVPTLDGGLEGASWWILARAEASDRSSTVVQRGLRDPSEAGVWPPFLEPPELDGMTIGVLIAAPPAGATLFVVERFDATSEDSTVYFDPLTEVEIEAPGAPGRVVVRAIDAAIGAMAFDLDAVEGAVVRWSETTWM